MNPSMTPDCSTPRKRNTFRLPSILRLQPGKRTIWRPALFIGLLVAVSFLVFYNLQINPRPWHDEGSAMSIPKTLVEDGVYAVHTSDGYQTYGGVQSVGPTVLLPIALSFRIFGIGLWQARVVVALFSLVTLILFYRVGLKLFGLGTGLLTVLLLLGSPGPEFLLHGRQVLGEVPALCFLLAGWLAWARSLHAGNGSRWLVPVSGLLFGAAMVTKSQYALIGLATIGSVVLLDWLFFRQGKSKQLIIIALIALACVAAWWAWQRFYFGSATFEENALKMRLLAKATSGFSLRTIVKGLTFLFGQASGNFYYFWGFPALLYVIMLSLRQDQAGHILAFLIVFTVLWLGYWLFFTLTWSRYAFPAYAIASLFVAKLWHDLARGLTTAWRQLWSEVRGGRPIRAEFSREALMIVGTLVALVVITAMAGYDLQRVVRDYVLDREGLQQPYVITAPQLASPQQVADYLGKAVDRHAVVETWERELDILTDHEYHFPDQAFLAQTDAAIYGSGSHEYALGEAYFQQVKPDFVVLGWYARYKSIYDTGYLDQNGEIVATFGQGDWRYDIYRLR